MIHVTGDISVGPDLLLNVCHSREPERSPGRSAPARLSMTSSAEISIRAAQTTDAEAIARLLGQLGYDATPADIASRLVRILTRSDHRFVIAEAEGLVVGWIHASVSEHIDSAACVLIEGLVVDRAHRGHGIGRVLLDDAEAWARAIGCSLVRLRSTDARTEAHQFYQHLGYTKVKTQHSFAKAVDPEGQRLIARLVPRVEH